MTIIHSFGASNGDGAAPAAGLTLGPDGNLYGTTSAGGLNGGGTVYQITLSGQETVVYSFDTNTSPSANLVLGKDGSLYGTTSSGGTFGKGTVFKLTL